MIRYSVLILLWIGLLGCSKAPAIKVYSIDVPQVGVSTVSKYRDKSIKVTFPQSLKEEISQKMNFSYSATDRGTYQNSEWSNNMAKLLQGTLIEVLASSKRFKVVLADSSTLRENYRLESNIFAFEHQVRGARSYASISVQFTLINADTGTLVKSRRFSYLEPTPSINAEGYASATNVAIKKLSKDLLAWLR